MRQVININPNKRFGIYVLCRNHFLLCIFFAMEIISMILGGGMNSLANFSNYTYI